MRTALLVTFLISAAVYVGSAWYRVHLYTVGCANNPCIFTTGTVVFSELILLSPLVVIPVTIVWAVHRMRHRSNSSPTTVR